MAYTENFIVFGSREMFDSALANNDILESSICFIEDTKEIWTQSQFYRQELQQVTYSELKTLRDSSKLHPGQSYRITDYTCTTIQEDTQSAGHVFDIIVTAVEPGKISEIARAVQHEGDTYFADSNLEAWQLWYDLDNDTTKYLWADPDNGKGVIWRMIDEFQNDCPYDFKNIQFKRYKTNGKRLSDGTIIMSDDYVAREPVDEFFTEGIKEDDFAFYYTFHYNTKDHSLTKCFNNVIQSYYNQSKRTLNNNIFVIILLAGNIQNVLLESNCRNNIFRGMSLSDIKLGHNCAGNIICSQITIGSNPIVHFGKYCQNNYAGELSYNIVYGDNCSNNIINSGQGITFSDYCCDNEFLCKNYLNITFKYACSHNIFQENTRYAKNIIFDSYSSYINLNATNTPSSDLHLRNIHIVSGVHGATKTFDSNGNITWTNQENRLNLNIDILSNDYQINVYKDSQDNLVIGEVI